MTNSKSIQGNIIPKQICLIDDEPDLLSACEDYLSINYEVKAFINGQDALKALDGGSFRPHLVICDIEIPGEDGFSISEKLRMRLPEIPIILMSGYAEKDHIKKAMEQKINKVLEKPFTLNTMEDTIESVLNDSDVNPSVENIINRYEIIFKNLKDLNQRYLDRCILTENKLEKLEHGGGIRVSNNARDYLKSIQKENHLNRVIDEKVKEIGREMSRIVKPKRSAS